MARRGWGLVIVAALGVAVVSLASNVTTTSQLSAEADTLLTVRSAVSTLVNSGTVWAGLAVLSGWLVRRPVHAATAGVVACLVALVVHYGLGRLFGMFDPNVWTANQFWFAAALVTGGPLGLVGAIARRSDLWGLMARLLVPVAAILEPLVIGLFTMPEIMPWPRRVSSVVAGAVLLAGGVVGAGMVLAHFVRSRRLRRGVPDRDVRPMSVADLLARLPAGSRRSATGAGAGPSPVPSSTAEGSRSCGRRSSAARTS